MASCGSGWTTDWKFFKVILILILVATSLLEGQVKGQGIGITLPHRPPDPPVSVHPPTTTPPPPRPDDPGRLKAANDQYETLLPTGEIYAASFRFDPDAKFREYAVFYRPITNRIVNGRTANSSEAPYQVGIFRRGRGIVCGGALYDHYTVITAAHCVKGFSRDDFLLGVGKIDLIRPERTESIVTVQDIFIHPEYDSRHYLRDIAIIKLSQSVCYNSRTIPIPLPKGNDTTPVGNLTISGWGYTRKRVAHQPFEAGYFPSDLKITEILFVPRDECDTRLESVGIYSQTVYEPTIFCAGVPNGDSDNCQGDSGGPVMCRDENGADYLCGIVSSGYGCGQPSTPALYTDVARMMPWILAVLEDENCAPIADEPNENKTLVVAECSDDCG